MMSNLERLVYMANQIARNFEAHGHDAAVRQTAACLADSGTGLSPTARAAIERLKA